MRQPKPDRALWRIAVLSALSGLLLAGAQQAIGKAAKTDSSSPLAARQKVVHALNRLTFGPRPGDVDRVMAQGLDKWIDQQLHPEHISDSQLEARLASFPTLTMNTRDLIENYPPPQVIKAIADGRMALPKDPKKRARYEAELERYRRRQQVQAQQQGTQSPNSAAQPAEITPPDPISMSDEDRAKANDAARSLMNTPAEDRRRTLSQMDPATRRAVVLSLRPDERRGLLTSLSPEQRASMREIPATRQVDAEVQQAKLLRAIYSERQLEEVLTDFWFNHFNVFIGKGLDRYLVTSYERDVIRPRVFGKFKDLLVATAQSPAMLWYLDNWQSVGPNSPLARNQGLRNQGFRNQRFRNRLNQRRAPQSEAQRQQTPPRGLNENYARELMELHTLGVDGGYTQKDVTEVARVFTGWTLDQPRRGGGFMFRPGMHDPGSKTVLGKRFGENGEKEGMQVLQMLARRPATAKFISTKLAQRFVADDPPPALIERMAATFLKTDGDLREVYRTMLRSPEFWDASAYRAKVKTPLEFVASAVRASGAEISNPMPLVRELNNMGMPLYGAQPPTGYSPQAVSWVNSAALLSRMNFALGLAGGRLPGVSFDAQQIMGPASIQGETQNNGNGNDSSKGNDEQVLQALGNTLLAGELSPQTRETIEKQLQNPGSGANSLPGVDTSHAVNLITGLLLGSPEFQRR
jgi:uncharacterized protein (DUF1800 family)